MEHAYIYIYIYDTNIIKQSDANIEYQIHHIMVASVLTVLMSQQTFLDFKS